MEIKIDRKSQSIISIIIVIISSAWIIFTTINSKSQDKTLLFAPQIGFLSPDFELADLNENIHKLSEYQGKPVILNVWASWCKPCREEMPALQRMYAKYNKEIIFLAVNSTQQDSLTDVVKFIEENQINFPVLLDLKGETNSLYKIQALPTTFFINSKGIIQEIIIGGPMSETLIEIRLKKLMEPNLVSDN